MAGGWQFGRCRFRDGKLLVAVRVVLLARAIQY
jgi:hypothetical protein